MASKLEVGIVGLGKFGMGIAEALVELGHSIIGIDKSETKVSAARGIVSQVYQADAMDRVALQQLGFDQLPYVVVSSGHSMEASILITLNLKELGVNHVWVKAISEDHEKILRKLGADFVVFPERFVARQLAHRIGVPGLVQYLPLGSGITLQELAVKNWSGQSLRDLDLTNKYGLQVVAVKRHDETDYSFVPNADKMLFEGDLLVTIGEENSLSKIEP
ncbi:potassium channel family protein [Oceanidesulfovibrio marinus]|uniref:TrkA family potassium uptake protein n=1 Tax=Oceanidesulfovibrio marinus TaxID=370038 RepID=A0A6P1ZL08_9BACT|nr:TrkA family potassium uptake protein [Oceanidesulfovibrio marinus]QJT07491.1 TrkA family potassium uptake protein [Oceanidesulfovibrio marinus]TVM34595.1 TrkA family potassium uptake protein [Oceanidesulfovibrio marinus]